MSFTVKVSQSWLCVVMLLLACTHCDPIKVNDCCMAVSNRYIRTPITSCKTQAPSHPCVQAVIFTSKGTDYCCSPRAPWVRAKMAELKRKGKPCTEWKKQK
ncbi:hypothetical protein AAFF_G00206670 [Aldrovandia affinis]|uniref:Chemokine interleukin-8-like domain-containing protein n=1 Tax=Aldrovandia affinis TaxID=143900 RepID=A0AAD7RHS8_9TELE|nr:hypothetical protein AAFF_G00206670 [Aldrovandia affinis]